MSTNDVPGHNPRNHDALAMGAWGAARIAFCSPEHMAVRIGMLA